MRALVIHAAHDLRIEEQEITAPKSAQVAVKIKAGGVCGSDLHYFNHGGFGDIRLREPMIPGHEVAGQVMSVGNKVRGIAVGDAVAINPSLPCMQCAYCLEGLPNHCSDMRFYGSAMRFPHVQGAFCEHLICEARQCVVLPDGIDMFHAAFSEPLSVGLHAANRIAQTGDGLTGKRVLVSGCGPIGCLALMVARHAGAAEIVVLDVADKVLSIAAQVGADRTINVIQAAGEQDDYRGGKGYFDVAIEASGVEAGILQCLELLRPRGVLAQLGLGGDSTIPMNLPVTKEISWLGSFRFHEEFARAANLIASGQINVAPLLSATVPIDEAAKAFQIAGDRNQSMKVQIAFNL
jgi:L-idonate 5-dehydrogenase